MFKTLALAAAGALALAAASPAQAQTFSPTNSTFELTGVLSIQHGGFAVDCDLAMEVSINAAGYAHVIDADFSSLFNFYCGFVVQPTFSIWGWSLAPGASGLDFTLEFSTPSGTCYGTVFNAGYANHSGELLVPDTVLGDTGAGWCSVQGYLYADPPFSV